MMRSCPGLLAFVFVVASALAQTAPTQSAIDHAAKPREKCTIEGVVSRSTDGAPLKKAIVTAVPQQQDGAGLHPVTAITDADGKFVLKGLDAGRYALSAMHTGYVRQTYGRQTPGSVPATLTLLEGQHVKDIVFRLPPGAAISGRVVDEDSEPISGVRIQAMRWGYVNGRRQLIPMGFAQTDDRGEYRIFQLAPGRYYLFATYTGPGYLGGGVMISDGNSDMTAEGYAPTYYPGVNDPAQASAVEVRAGDDLPGINLRLIPTHAVRISGRVVKAGGQPATAVFVHLSRRRTSGFSSFAHGDVVDEHGAFTFSGVTAGSYVLMAESDERGTPRLQGRVAIDVDTADVEGVVLALQPPLEVTGQLRVEGNAELQHDRVHVVLAPQEPTFGGSSSRPLNSDLKFTIPEMQDGDYTLRVFGLPADTYVSSATMGRRDVLRNGATLHGTPEPLQIVITTGGRLDGTVLDEQGKPFAGARVVLIPEERYWKRQDLFKIASSDQYGQFSMRGIAPGHYMVLAWEAVEDGAYYDPEFLRTVLDRAKAVEVSATSSSEAEVKVIRSDGSGG